MRKHSALAVAALIFVLAIAIGSIVAQDHSQSGPRPMFAHPMPVPALTTSAPNVSLQTFTHTYNFVGDGGNQTVTIVGTDPSSSNVTTTIPVLIIPVKLVFTVHKKRKVFDPNHVLPNGNTVIQNTINSPIFQSGIDFVQGGVDLGNTQYIDAYERGNFWTDVMTNTDYHLLLQPTVLPTQTLFVPKNRGTVVANPFGTGKVGIANIRWFFPQLLSLMTQLPQIQPNTFPIFEFYDVYLSGTSKLNGCCIGGFHDVAGTQTFAQFDYEDAAGSFSQDVSALSHEVGEWLIDPMISNFACGGLMENGDPLEREANFGGFPYTLNGFTYNLQDLVFLNYFGQSPPTSVNGWESFQNASLTTCSNGQ